MKRILSNKLLTIACASLMLAVVLNSCDHTQYPKVITDKRYTNYEGKPMPKGICRLWYKTCPNCDENQFEDSCHKYNIGDTINGVYKNYR
jgi:hypothetical protein